MRPGFMSPKRFEQPLEELRGVRAGDEQLAERGDVDDAERVVDVLGLGGRVAVGVGTTPGSRYIIVAPRKLLVAVVDRGPLRGLVLGAGEEAGSSGCQGGRAVVVPM